MTQLQALVDRWLRAEAGGDEDVEVRAAAAMQALPAPAPSRNLVTAVMAALAPASLWSRRPVRYLVTSTLVMLGLGIIFSVRSAPALAAIARLSLWRDLGSHLLVTTIDFGVDLMSAADTVWRAVASSPAASTFSTLAPWIALGLFVTGTTAMSWISLLRDKENWHHV